MDRDTVIFMARKAGLFDSQEDNPYWTAEDTETLARFASLIAARERAECARIADKILVERNPWGAARWIAAQIRSRQ